MIWYLWICYALWLSRFWWFKFSYCSQCLKWHGLDLQKNSTKSPPNLAGKNSIKEIKISFFSHEKFVPTKENGHQLWPRLPYHGQCHRWNADQRRHACCREEHLWSVWAKAISRKSVFCLCHNVSELLEETIWESYGITIWWIKHGRWVGNYPSSLAREMTPQGFC